MRRCAQCQIDYPDALEFCPRDGEKLPPIPGDTKELYDPLIGTTIDGRYAVESVLGEGGMGMVYACRHAIIDKRVAIKVLRKEAAADDTSAQRFLAEAKAASKIGQQNIVDITDFGVLTDGHAYFVMEYLDGPTLGRIIHKEGAIAPSRAASIAIQVCRGLSAAHNKGIIHRDLKPENIFVMQREGMSDYVKIVDFGIARDASSKKRLTVAGMVMGTPEYMAPEQASGQETDHRVDQYSLGCILYETLTGKTPFRGDNPMQTLTKHVFDAVTPPSQLRPELTIPPALEAIIMRTLAKKRDERYASMDALMQALTAIEPSLRGIAVPGSSQRRETVRAGGSGSAASSARRTTARPDGSRPGESTLSAELEVPRRRPTVFVAVVALLVVAGAVAAFMLRAPPPPIVTTPPIAVPKPPPTNPPPVAHPTPPVAADIAIEIVTQPAGVDVYDHDELLGPTPRTITRLSTTGELELTFRKAGYKEERRVVPADRDAHLVVSLVHEPVATKTTLPKTGPNTKPPVAPPPTVPKPPQHRNTELRNPFDEPQPH